MSCCRWSGVGLGLALLLIAAIAVGCKQKPGASAPAVKAATTTAASVPGGVGDATRPVDLTVLPEPVRRALSGGNSGGAAGRLGAAWSGGEVGFTNDEPVFRIARDYDQELAVPVRSRSKQSRRIVATIEPFGGGLLVDFVGAGSAERPIDLPPGGEGTLALHVYAQDAARQSYRTTAFLRDAQSREVLAASPVTVFVAQPKFSLSVKVGEQEPGTLGRKFTVQNDGESLTDFSVRPGPELEGRLLFQPSVEHAELPRGRALAFTVMPRLATDFTKAEGSLVLSGAGQERTQAVSFALPPGKHVFVATSFSTTDAKASGKYCTNNPNTNTPIGGPAAPADDPYPLIGYDPNDPLSKYYHDGTPIDGGKGGDDDDQGPIGRLADYLNSHLSARGIPGTNIDTNGRVKLGGEGFGVKVSSDTGAAKGSDPTGPLVDTNYTVKVGPVTVVKGTGTVSISPQVADQVNIGSNSTPTGRALNNTVGGGGGGGVQGGPRGLRVRDDYAAFRRGVYHDNEPESVVAVGAGSRAQRVILQTWHSDRWCLGTGRQILLRLWDGTGARRLSRDIMLTDSNTFGQWPAALALPDGRALVVWETSRTWHGPPSLAYRVSTYGYGNWSEQRAIPGGDDPAGNYDAMPAMGADGVVRIFWQRGRGAAARIFFTHGTDAGELAPAMEVKGLPAGATRPVVRAAGGDGATMHLVCTVEATPPKVVYGISRDGGATFEQVTGLSPAALDCGDADLLVAGDELQCAFRAGAAWESRIMHTTSHDGGKIWSQAKAVTAEDQYAEYPVLVDQGAGRTELRYHGGARADRALVTAPGAAPASTRAILKQFAIASDAQQAWSAPRRLLTDFPAVQAAWLEVEFNLRTPRGQYSPHEISVLLNGQPLIHQIGVIPEGTYLLPLDPALLASDANGLGRNTIGLRTVHMSPGHYQSAANFRLQARHAFRETMVVADTQEAADALAAGESESINHGRADVGVFARFVEAPQTPTLIPASPKQGEVITLPLRVGNIGETAASAVVVHVYASGPDRAGKFTGEPVGEAMNLGDLAPLAIRDVEVKFPYGGAERYYVVSTHAGADFDPSNDVHQVSFAVPKAPSIRAIEAAGNQPIVAMVSDDPQAPFRWRILDARNGKEVARVEQGTLHGSVPPGKYRLAMQRFEYEGQEVTFPDEVEKKENQPLRASLRTAVEVEFPTWAAPPFRWELVRADKPDQVLQWLYGEHAMMLVPPGDYRLAMKPKEYGSNRVVWPEVIHLEPDAHRVVKLDGGVAPPAMLAKRAVPFRWGLWKVGDGQEREPLQFAADWRAIAAPPGRYQWGVQPLAYKSMAAMFPPVEVKAGELTRPEDPAIFVLTPSKWSGVPYSYSLVDPRTKKAVQRIKDGGVAEVYVPAGDYDLHVQPSEYKSREVVMAKGMRLGAGHQVRIMLDSGVELAAAGAAGSGLTAPWQVTFYREGNAKEIVQQLRGAPWGATPLPAGSYRLGIKAEQYRGQEVLSPRPVVVTAGKVTRLTLDKGMGVMQAEGQ